MSGTRDTRRRFEQWARNPECQANVVSAVTGTNMATVAKAEGLEPSMGQSPFAIARGVTFERELLKDGASILREALEKAGVLPDGSSGFEDLRIGTNSGPMANLDAAHDRTMEILEEVADSEKVGTAPSIVASATITIPGQPVMLPDGMLAIDALVIRPGGDGLPELVVGEVKSYPYRAGHTDVSELATSRAQAGLYRHALALAVESAGLEGRIGVADGGFLVLSWRGTNRPTVLADEDLAHQALRAQEGFTLLRTAAKGLEAFDPAEEDDAVKRVEEAPIHYLPDCLSFCDRAPRCRKLAESAGEGNVLGEGVGRFLGEIEIGRALELMGGAIPVGDTEADLVERIREITTKVEV